MSDFIADQMPRLSESQERGDLTITQQPQMVQQADIDKKPISFDQIETQIPKRGWRFWLIFPGLCFAILLAALDTAIVATVLPTISAELNAGSLFIGLSMATLLALRLSSPCMVNFLIFLGEDGQCSYQWQSLLWAVEYAVVLIRPS